MGERGGPFLLGLDIGTTGARALAVTTAGRVAAEAVAGYPLSTPRPGWTEQRPEDWWAGARRALAQVTERCGGEIAGLGLTGQMHGAVFLDEADHVIRPALLWNDQRTYRQCDEITERVGSRRLLEIAGNPALTGFQAPKLLWLRDEEPESWRRLATVLLPKDYVRLQLTGERMTDVSDASGTLLLDLERRSWSEEVLGALELPPDWFPAVLEGPAEAGRLRGPVAADLGLPEGLPVAAGGGDNAAAAIGTGIIREGLVSSSIGTSGVVFAHTEHLRRDRSGRLHAFCHAVPGAYHLMGVTLAAGGSLGWWRELLHDLDAELDYDRLTALAEAAPPGSEGLVFLPYLTGERTPHLDPFARGAFFGLTARHRIPHLTRAVMEGVVCSLRECLELIREAGAPIEQIRATGGGARSGFWRRLQAEVYGCPIHLPEAEEGPAYGAALLGGVAARVFDSVADACQTVRLRPDVDVPDPERAAVYERQFAVYRSLYGATRDAMHALHDAGSARVR